VTDARTAAAEDIEIDLTGLPKGDLLEWLETMLLIRRFEERAERLGSRGAIPGGIHSAAGQEAVAVGTMRALHPSDPVAGTHRSHHTALAKGLEAPHVMAELYGRATGSVGGRGGTMHLADLDRGYLGGNGIVGAGVGIAMGAALACQLKGEGVAVGFVGDGGLNVGRTWEAANLAVIWDLPLIIVCENNMYAVETRFDLVLGGGSAVRRAEGFGLNAVSVDGQDVAAVYRAVHAAAERARTGGGASFVEARTYRYEGHNTGQIITYRTDDEVADWRLRDPINRFSAALVAAGVIAEGDVEGMDSQATALIDDAVEFAESSPFPDLDTAPANVTSMPTESWESR
jgi:TPP-dependent pyruvate/acetoin dehydrogenase alpha subunit